MKHIFISGIAGFLGSHIAELFLEAGCRVSGVDNLIGGYIDNVPAGAVFYKADLLNREIIDGLLDGVDVVYNCACTAYEGLSVFSPALVCENTTQISINLFVASIKAGVKRFIHCSSMARYGSIATDKYTESMNCSPQDPYGIAKYHTEILLKNLAETHGIELVIAVPHNIIGPRQKYDDPYRNVASIMINLMLQGRQPIIYGDGLQTRCFSDIRDVTWCLYEMSRGSFDIGEVFNVGPDENPITVLALGSLIANIVGVPYKPVFTDERPREVKHAVCSSDKIRTAFGYKTSVSLTDSLTDLVHYIKSRGPLPFRYHLDLEIINDKTPKTWLNRLF